MNKVFIATSLDGFIADLNGGIEWLHSIENPEGNDMGYGPFMNGIDALLMGITTFETVCSFDMDWPYDKPVFVLSNSLQSVPDEYVGKAEVVKGALAEVIQEINNRGFQNLYIDGGRTIQSLLREDMIDEMTITLIPILLGGGIPLFGELPASLGFECVETKHYLGKMAQNRFVRIR